MSNKTDAKVLQIHGQNPQSMIDKIVRNRIYSNIYWKEQLAGLNAEELVDKAIQLKFIGGTYGGVRQPTQFLCLICKLLQICPQKEIIFAFIDNQKYKYVRALGMFYLRLVGTPEEIYKTIEKTLEDSRKIIERKQDASFELIYIDVLADKLLNDDKLYDIVLPRIPDRELLEEMGKLGQKISPLEEEMEKMFEHGQEMQEILQKSEKRKDKKKKKKKKRRKEKDHSRSRSKEKKHKKTIVDVIRDRKWEKRRKERNREDTESPSKI